MESSWRKVSIAFSVLSRHISHAVYIQLSIIAIVAMTIAILDLVSLKSRFWLAVVEVSLSQLQNGVFLNVTRPRAHGWKNTNMEWGLSREYLAVILTYLVALRTFRNYLNSSSQWIELTKKCLLLGPGIKGFMFSVSRARCHSIRFGVPKKGAYRVCDFLIRSSPSGRQSNASHDGERTRIAWRNGLVHSILAVLWTKKHSIYLYGGNTN